MNYYITQKHAGYGYRIWIQEEDMSQAIEARMKFLSKWRGFDKRHEGKLSWEFGDEAFHEACAYLEGYGFTPAEY